MASLTNKTDFTERTTKELKTIMLSIVHHVDKIKRHHASSVDKSNKVKKEKALGGSVAGELREDLLSRDEGGHRLLGQGVARHQVLVET
jgi:hypothetical protein